MRTLLLLCMFIFGNGFAAAAGKSTGVPRYDEAVASGVRYLRSQAGNIPERETSLVAYAMVKAGESVDDELVQHGLRDALERTEKGHSGYEHIYMSGVDAMLLAEVHPEQHLAALQKIADYVASRQHASGGWSDSTSNADTSMAQYAMLALWAAKGAGATISPEVVERNIGWHLNNGTREGSWGYRPEGANLTPTHNLAMAGAASLGIGRLLLYGPKNKPKKEVKPEKILGVLDRVDYEEATEQQYGFKDYRPQISGDTIDARIARAFNWIEVRFPPPQTGDGVFFKYYFFYALERAAALCELDEVNGGNWFETYGDILLTMRNSEGVFDRDSKQYSSSTIGTSFAILYFMRSTQQTLDKQYGLGHLLADRGDPFGDKKVKEPTELDRLISDISNMDFDALDETPVEVADDIVQSVLSIDDPEKLIGQVDQLKSLMKHPNDKVRSAAVWALGRTGDFKLIPLLLEGIRDNSVDVNIEAIQALRFIARKPHGFGETLAPLASLGTENQIQNASPEERLRLATPWREKALKDWSNWYFSVRPFEDRSGFDELQLAVPLKK